MNELLHLDPWQSICIHKYYHCTRLMKKKRLVRFIRSNILIPILWMRKKNPLKEEEKKTLYIFRIYMGHSLC